MSLVGDQSADLLLVCIDTDEEVDLADKVQIVVVNLHTLQSAGCLFSV